MKKYWYGHILTMILLFSLLVGGGIGMVAVCQNENQEETVTQEVTGDMVIPGGMPIGIYMETDGVMVLGTDTITGIDGLNYEPANHLVKPGDYIVGMNDLAIQNKKELIDAVSQIDRDEVVLHLRRAEEEIDVKLKPVQSGTDEYKLGIWVRDNAQGLGTVTFLTSNSEFGALGHGIHDVDTSCLLEIADGALYATSIRDIQKGESGSPGGMEGIIVYNEHNLLGDIRKNTEAGIFGSVDKIDTLFENQTPMEIGTKEMIEVGDAQIRCAVDGTVQEYNIRITKIDLNCKEINKGIVIEVTDPRLLELTGGIVQGMSGSPIIQNDRIIGAVTHVFVQDATKGYGIFIENMLANM